MSASVIYHELIYQDVQFSLSRSVLSVLPVFVCVSVCLSSACMFLSLSPPPPPPPPLSLSPVFICLCIHPFISVLPACLSLSLSVLSYFYLFVCLSVSLSTCLPVSSVHPSICSAYQFVFFSLCLSIYLSLSGSVRLFAYESVGVRCGVCDTCTLSAHAICICYYCCL